MGMQINTNVSALNTSRNLNQTQNSMTKSLERLSTGLRINRASDDAAGLTISEGLKSQIGGLAVAGRNAQDGISVIQTAEGALTEAQSILNRMRDLGVQASNDSNNAESRTAIKTEVDELSNELNRIVASTNFNGTKLLDGTAGTAGVMNFQVGAGSGAENSITVNMIDISAKLGGAIAATDGAGSTLTFDNATNAKTSIGAIDDALKAVSAQRSDLGAKQNRLESAANTIATSAENLTAARSRITDTDMAAEMVNFTRSQILSQAGTSMLAQANQSSQSVLQLLN